ILRPRALSPPKGAGDPGAKRTCRSNGPPWGGPVVHSPAAQAVNAPSQAADRAGIDRAMPTRECGLAAADGRFAGDDAAGDARTGITGRIALVVVGIGVDHE